MSRCEQIELTVREEFRSVAERYICDALGDVLDSLILTGSMARNEESWLSSASGWRLRGDAEFIAVIGEGVKLPDVKSLAWRLEERLVLSGIHASVSISAVRRLYLRSLKPGIFAFELKECGRVCSGDRRILKLIPEWEASQLPREDAWRLLCNRMIELIESVAREDSGHMSDALRYRSLKLVLDTATSLLVFCRKYCPTYQGRRIALGQLARTEMPIDVSELSALVDLCTALKVSATSSLDAIDWKTWSWIVRTVHSLWRWETAILSGVKDNSYTDVELVLHWAKSQPLAERGRGWAYVTRQALRTRYADVAGLQFAWSGSPRYRLYAAAIGLWQNLPYLMGPERDGCRHCSVDAMQNLLPFVRRRTENLPWRNFADQIARNYHLFLEGTTS